MHRSRGSKRATALLRSQKTLVLLAIVSCEWLAISGCNDTVDLGNRSVQNNPNSVGHENTQQASLNLSEPQFRIEVVGGEAPVRAEKIGDVKVHLTPESTPQLLVTAQLIKGTERNRAYIYRRSVTGVWTTQKVEDIYREAFPGADVAGSADTRVTFVPQTTQIWLASSVQSSTGEKTKLLIRSNDFGATWDMKTAVLHDTPATHEGSVTCSSANSCIYIGYKDPLDRTPGRTDVRIYNGNWCPSTSVAEVSPMLPTMTTSLREGQYLMFLSLNSLVKSAAGATSDVQSLKLTTSGCKLTASPASTMLYQDIQLAKSLTGRVGRTVYNFAAGIVGAAAASSQSDLWTVAQDVKNSQLLLRRIDKVTTSTLASLSFEAGKRAVYYNPGLDYDNLTKQYSVFYMRIREAETSRTSYDLCTRSASLGLNAWSSETCIENISFKSATSSLAEGEYGFFNNFIPGATESGKRAIAIVTDCDEKNSAAEESCALKIQHNLN